MCDVCSVCDGYLLISQLWFFGFALFLSPVAGSFVLCTVIVLYFYVILLFSVSICSSSESVCVCCSYKC